MKKRLTSLALAAILLCGTAVSCGDEGNANETANPSADTTAPAEDAYTFTKDYAGSDVTILNCEDNWWMHAQITREEQTGEVLDDTMYDRCRALEENMGVTLDEILVHIFDLGTTLQTSVMAGDDEYDIAYIGASSLMKYANEGYLNNLLDYDALALDEPWWIGSYNDSNMINGGLYAAAGYAQMMVLDSLWSLQFNETMMDKLGLDYPYSLVDEGKWTLDVLKTYLAAAANLNGDDSFAFNDNSKCVYGISIPSGNSLSKFMYGTGEYAVEAEDGKLVFTAGTERFYDAFTKLTNVLTENDGHAYYQHGVTLEAVDGYLENDRGSHMEVFESQQALFRICEICKTTRMRDKEYSFGLLPFPKLDENQDGYYHSPFDLLPCFTIPVTVEDPVRSAKIGDALNYLSWDMVLPVWRETTMEQKNLRNDESIGMLNIIIESLKPALCDTYGIGKAMMTQIAADIEWGRSSAASIVASHKESILAEIEAINK